MKNIHKVKTLSKAVVVIAIALAFVIPVTAMTPGTSVTKKTWSESKNHAASVEWFEQASGFPTVSRGINFISVVDQNIVWAAGYDGTNPLGPCQDFTRTVDGGTTWVADTIAGADGLSFAMIFALDANTAWACMYASAGGVQGIYKTTDGGSHWAQQTTAAFDAASFPDCVHFWDANVGWCLGDPKDSYYEIYTTTDGGTTWTRVPSADIPAPLSGEYGVVGYYTVVGDTVWFGTDLGRVYKSIDKGLHWTVAQTTLSAYIKPAFKDANNGLVIDLNAAAAAELAETSDGGTTWTTIPFSGPCYDNDLCYVPETTNMYISVGGASGMSGASYSLDGGHTWTDYEDVLGIQLLALGFTTGKIGWAGSFNTDEVTGGMFKHIPSGVPQPAFSIDVTGGKGINVTVHNVGDGDATSISYTVNITNGLWVKTRTFSGTHASLAAGTSFSFAEKITGIGLGILKPIPSIKVTVTCSQGVTQEKVVNAKIVFSKVTIQ
jgi:hypothetical protein